MIYAITGAHSTGKTTLGKALAQELGYKFVTIDSSALKIASSLGEGKRLDEFGPNDQAKIQIEYCQQLQGLYEMMLANSKENFITDSHPITPLVYGSFLIKGEVHNRYNQTVVDEILKTVNIAGLILDDGQDTRIKVNLVGRKLGINDKSDRTRIHTIFTFPTIPLEDNGFRPLDKALRYNISKMIREITSVQTFLWQRDLNERIQAVKDMIVLKQADNVLRRRHTPAFRSFAKHTSSFFALEGVPGLGKTTAIDMIRNLHSESIIFLTPKRAESSHHRKQEWKEIWDRKDPHELLMSYAISMQEYQERALRENISISDNKTEPVITVMDRCIYTAIATAVGSGMTLDEALDRIPHKPLYDVPYVFLLVAPERIRIERCKARGEDTNHSPKNDSELQENIAEAYREIILVLKNASIIPVGPLSEKDQLRRILNHLVERTDIKTQEIWSLVKGMWSNMEPNTKIPNDINNWILESQIQLGSLARIAMKLTRGISIPEGVLKTEVKKQVGDILYSTLNIIESISPKSDPDDVILDKIINDYLKLRMRIPIGNGNDTTK